MSPLQPASYQGRREPNKDLRLLKTMFKFKVKEPLGKFVFSKTRQKREVYTLAEILTVLKNHILRGGILDDSNPSIILCDRDLEEALGVKALHKAEITEIVLRKLEKASDDSPQSLDARTHLESQDVCSSIPSSSVPPKISAQAITTTKQISHALLPSASGTDIYNDPSARFILKPKFLSVIQSVPGIYSNQTRFSYKLVTDLLSKYILAKKDTIFDPRNVRVALVGNDPLGEAFNLKSFHRSQVTNLIQSQLIPCTMQPLTKSQNLPANQVKLLMDEWLESLARRRRAEESRVNECSSVPSTSTKAVLKRSISSDSIEKGIKKPREDDPEGKTEIHSIIKNHGTTVADPDGRVKDVETEDTATPLVYSMEYDVHSSSEDEKRPKHAGGCTDTESNSEKDTDSEDSHKVPADLVAVMERALESDSSYLGDKDEEEYVFDEKELDFSFPKIKEKDDWRCKECDKPNPPFVNYCGKCWKIRKGWIPDRPKPRKVRPHNSETPVKSCCGSAKEDFKCQDASLSEAGLVQRGAESDYKGSKEAVTGSCLLNMEISIAGGTAVPYGDCSKDHVKKESTKQDLCMFCNDRPKDTSFLHGRLSHQVSCHQCAKKHYNKQSRCPICRRKIDRIIKNLS